MRQDAPALATLEKLATSEDIRDRAFASSALQLRRGTDHPEYVARLYGRIRDGATRDHAGVRAQIKEGTLESGAFLARLADAPLEIRDHLVEEILDIAYPPLEEIAAPRDGVHYSPSGLAEILFTLEHANLGRGKTFVDLGSGLGKVVLLIALLSGARAIGFELEPNLVARARDSARSLDIRNAEFATGDIRDVPLPVADVYYMYIPLTRSADIAARLQAIAAEREVLLFSQSMDLSKLPWLRSRAASSYWLEVYEGSLRR